MQYSKLISFYRALQEYLSCPSILSLCDDFGDDQEEKMLEHIVIDETIKEALEFCQSFYQAETELVARNINKRSPVAKKRGRSRTSSTSSSSKNRGRVSSNVRKAFSGNVGRKGQKILGNIFGRKKGVLGSGGKLATGGVKRKGSIFKKVGKYAVAGLAGNDRM